MTLSRRPRFKISRGLLYTLLIVSSAVMAFPLLFMFLGSIGTTADYTRSPWLPIPSVPTLENYAIILNPGKTDVWKWVANTLIRAAWYIVIPGIISVLCGYVFAKLSFRGRDAAFTFLLMSLMLPGIVFQVPTFVMMARFPLAGGNNILGQGGTGFINQWPALLIPGLVSVYYIFMLRQTFYSIPADFEEAARVDGAGTLRCLFSVYLPMLKPVLTVLVIFQFVGIWNDYIWPLFVTSGNPQIYVMALGFQYLQQAGNSLKGLPNTVTDYPFTFALAACSILPLVIMFLFLQKYFVEGVAGFAIKG
ncbi:MAG: carbohydrate ABC transporter permease [Chloroflexi bacterium]|nr:carbohydrate ABC transporter permease [Chloroflexota bacterium]